VTERRLNHLNPLHTRDFLRRDRNTRYPSLSMEKAKPGFLFSPREKAGISYSWIALD
jgi:hypothetical protein